MFDFVEGVAAFIHQPGVAPANPKSQQRAFGRHGQQAVVVAQSKAQLIGFQPTVVGQFKADQARADDVGNVFAIYGDTESRDRVHRVTQDAISSVLHVTHDV